MQKILRENLKKQKTLESKQKIMELETKLEINKELNKDMIKYE